MIEATDLSEALTMTRRRGLLFLSLLLWRPLTSLKALQGPDSTAANSGNTATYI